MTEQRYVEQVPEALDGQRLDRVVALIADLSRNRAATLIADGMVTVDGAVVEKTSVKLETDAVIAFTVENESNHLEPDASIEVPVLYVDDDLIIVDKPAGLVVHPGSGVTEGTMAHGLLATFPELGMVGEWERPGIVHRLDKGTSGVMMVGRTELAHQALSVQLKQRDIERRYRALVLGHLESDSGMIDAPLGRSPRDAVRRAVVADGRPARTRYEVVDRLIEPVDGGEVSSHPGSGHGGSGDVDADVGSSPPTRSGLAVSLLRCRLETGRTHQIRAHLSAIGHPVVGDDLYGGGVGGGGLGALARPFLHAESLGLTHPVSGEWMTFQSPLPDDLAGVLSGLRRAPDA